ncbi:MAG TPA: ABC transporter permease [Pseudonocardiaceae bacterium]|jgi:NitT/TauT family transport system permease protein|nr:ABC transporter permease [Pseudonocardiaceae bacterium]
MSTDTPIRPVARERLVTTRRTDNRTEKYLFGVTAVILVVALWELVAALRIEPVILLPGPVDVIDAFQQMFSSDTIWQDLGASGAELLYGLVLAAVVGIPVGMLLGWYRRVGYVFDPFVNFFYSIPRIALGPLLIVWLGIGLSSKVTLVFLMALFPIVINTTTGVRDIDPQLVRASRCFGGGDLQIFRTIALPGAVPFVLSGLRLAVGQALIGVFVAELMGAQHGIGLLMNNAGQQFQTATVFAGLIIFAVAGFVLTVLLRRAERHFDAWRS